MKNIFYILILFSSINSLSQSSEEIKLLNSDRLISGPKNDYWICIGNVIFQHNNALMYCDSSHHFSTDNKIIAFGNIKIKKGDSLNISGRKLIYNGDNNVAYLIGEVLLKDQHTQLTTSEISLNLEDNIAYYPNKGIITDQDVTLISDQGSYDTESHLFYFKKNITVESEDYIVKTDTLNYNSKTKTTFFLGPSNIFSDQTTIYCENGWHNTKSLLSQFRKNASLSDEKYFMQGDSLFFDRKNGYGKAINKISMIDTSNNMIVNGNLAEYFENESKIEITKQAVLNILFEQDTLFITADKFINYQNEEEYILAYNNVQMFKTDFQGKCDSLYYNISDSTVYLYHQPILWIDDMQISSDSIKIRMFNKKIDKMNFFPNPIVISKADSLHFNQIKGKYMTGIFQQNKLKRLNVIGNGQSLFLIQEDKENIGINHAICTDISINIKDRRLNNITYKISPTSITIPLQDIKESDKYLEGFNWRIAEKPHNK